ncbi:MAG: acyltransferase [Candidatus Omnitrophica bacterium]|nr:acyltransferase [Candidatus Omnitrophota bacterium]
MKHVPALDSLRGIAVLLVVFHHFKWLGIGWIGVQIFFVLSGFLITSILWEQKDRRLRHYLGRFYWRRILRIFPVYYGFLFAVSLAYLSVGEPVAFGDLAPWLFSYTYNFARFFEPEMTWRYFGHLWSLAIEEQFYLVWPFVVYWVSKRSFLRLCIALVMVAPLFRWAAGLYFLAHDYPPVRLAQCVYTLPTTHLDAFAVGAALSVMDSRKLPSPRSVFLGVFIALTLLGFYQWGLLDPHSRVASDFGYPIYLSANLQYIWGYTLVNLLGGAMILCAVRGVDLFPGWNNRTLRFYGKISYALYVCHWPLLGAIGRVHDYNPWSLEGLCIFVLFFATATFISWLSFRYYETWFLRLKDRHPF